jgi:hypothetical protein
VGLNVGQLVTELRRMTVTERRRKYVDVCGEETRSNHKDYLVRRIAWRAQANAEGGLPERARQRALEIANDADLRTRAPGPPRPSPAAVGSVTRPIDVPADARLPMPGALLTHRRNGVPAPRNGLQ